MAKSSGLGDNFYARGYNLSGDVSSLGSISNSHTPLETTGIDKSAIERIGGLRTGVIEFTSFFNDAALAEHAALSSLNATTSRAMYFRGTTLGNAAAGMTCLQVNYDGTRAADGSFTLAVQLVSDGFGLEWGRSLTAGVRTDTGATNGASIDTAASASFGGQAYLQNFTFSGTDVTVKIQDSADDASWADVAGFASTAVVAAPTSQRFSVSNTTTIRRYVRAVTTTSGGFTSFSFALMIVKNEYAGLVF